MKHLTGRTRFRPNGKKLVLQIQEATPRPIPATNFVALDLKWRDARVEDLCEVQPGEDKASARKLH